MELIPPNKQYNITHYQQRFNWDCGLSCVLMILSTTNRTDFINNFEAICREEGFGISTWTIDLCYLLHRFHVQHEYFTQTIGIDPIYKRHMYYRRIIDKDERRVINRFAEAKGKGLHVEEGTVDINLIVKHLARHGPIIVLTNASLLSCEICHKNVNKKSRFAGHYVVLSGYDIALHKLFYHNPEVRDGHICRCPAGSMEMARKSFGTDEDIIFIFEEGYGKK